MKYRAEVDGLRAIAVISVIFYHAGLIFFGGGFVGVDVFFVISGYLITTIIAQESDSGNFSFLRFYEKRARRILPPLFLMMMVVAVAAPLYLIPSQIKDVAQSIVAAALFLSNYFFYLETDYFNQFTNQAPLLHTWSLAVEEQFYVLYPILIVVLARVNSDLRLFGIFILLVVSFWFSIDLVDQNRNLAFYSLHTRAWELMVGAVVALILMREDWLDIFGLSGPPQRIWEIISAASMIALLASFYFFDNQTRHPSWTTLIPVLAAALIIMSTVNAAYVRRLLCMPWLVHIGLMSYGLYLFHNPVFSFIDSQFEIEKELVVYFKFASLPFLYAVSFFSYRYFENPIRTFPLGKRILTFGLAGFFIFIFSVVGAIGQVANGFQSYFSKRFERAGGVGLVNVDKEKLLIADIRANLYPADKPFTCSNSCVKIVSIGDSFSEDVYFSLKSIHPPQQQLRRIALDDSCMRDKINVSPVGSWYLACPMFGGDVTLDLLKTADIIIITAKWQESTYQSGYDFAKHLASTTKAHIFVVGSVMFADLSSMSLKFAKLGVTPKDSTTLMYSYLRWDRLAISNKLRALVHEDSRLSWIEKKDLFCPAGKNECNLFQADGLPLIWDNAHLTVRGYPLYGQFLMNRLYLKMPVRH